MTFFYDVKNLDFEKFQNVEDLIPVVRYRGCSNICSFRDMKLFRIVSKFFNELRYELEIIIYVVRLCQGTLRICKFCLQIWLLKTLQFSRYDVFCDFFIFSKKIQEN